MSNNLSIWDSVSQSDPKFLKKISFGARSFTAIDPHYQIKSVTEAFGPVGKGWGWTSSMDYVPMANGDTAVIAHIEVWHGDRSNSYGPFSGCRKFFDNKKGRIAEDAPKMAVTDGLTKAISHLGFNADVFLGQMDGNKYADNTPKGGGSDW